MNTASMCGTSVQSAISKPFTILVCEELCPEELRFKAKEDLAEQPCEFCALEMLAQFLTLLCPHLGSPVTAVCAYQVLKLTALAAFGIYMKMLSALHKYFRFCCCVYFKLSSFAFL